MIRIQKLKQPKATSGKKLETDEGIFIQGVQIKNANKFPVYVDSYKRKPRVQKSPSKVAAKRSR